MWAHRTQGYWSLAAGALPSANRSLPSSVISCLIWSAPLATRPHGTGCFHSLWWWPFGCPVDSAAGTFRATFAGHNSRCSDVKLHQFSQRLCPWQRAGGQWKHVAWLQSCFYSSSPDDTIVLNARNGWFWNCILYNQRWRWEGIKQECYCTIGDNVAQRWHLYRQVTVNTQWPALQYQPASHGWDPSLLPSSPERRVKTVFPRVSLSALLILPLRARFQLSWERQETFPGSVFARV